MQYLGRVLVTQSCLTLCYPMECSLQISFVYGILRQEYWSGLPFPSPEDLPDPEIEPWSPALMAESLPSELLYTEYFSISKYLGPTYTKNVIVVYLKLKCNRVPCILSGNPISTSVCGIVVTTL